MSHSFPPDLQRSIRRSLQDIAEQMGHSIDQATARQLYQEASALLEHLACEPLTLARVAATLLVYQVQETASEEVDWFRAQVQECPDDEAVEELVESLHRADDL